MTNDELTALLGSPADIPQLLEEQSTYTAVRHLDLLPLTFTTADAIETGKQHTISARTTKRRVSGWLKAQFINQLSHGKYEKRMEKDL